MKKYHILLIMGIMISVAAVMIALQYNKDNSGENSTEYKAIIAKITDDFTQQQETLNQIVNTLPTDYIIQGGESSLSPILAKNTKTQETFYNEEIAILNDSLYASLCDLKSNNFMFYEIYNQGGYISFVVKIKEFTSFSIIHIDKDDNLKDTLSMYDGYSMLVENEWLITWCTRKGT